MAFRKQLVQLLIVFACCHGCKDDCENTSPPPTKPISFVIVDDTGKNLVTGDTSRFHPDSIKLFESDNKTNIIFKAELNPTLQGFWFLADCFKNENGSSTLYLHLGSSDMDTLLVSYETIRDDCFTIHQYTHVLHNGKEVFASGETNATQIIK